MTDQPRVTDQSSMTTPSPVATLFPGYFAMVMATGIIAIAARQQELDGMADVLYLVAFVTYVVLAVLLLVRLVVYPRRLLTDLFSHAKGFAFLTIVAGTNVLGSASAVIHGWWAWPKGSGGSASCSGRRWCTPP